MSPLTTSIEWNERIFNRFSMLAVTALATSGIGLHAENALSADSGLESHKAAVVKWLSERPESMEAVAEIISLQSIKSNRDTSWIAKKISYPGGYAEAYCRDISSLVAQIESCARHPAGDSLRELARQVVESPKVEQSAEEWANALLSSLRDRG